MIYDLKVEDEYVGQELESYYEQIIYLYNYERRLSFESLAGYFVFSTKMKLSGIYNYGEDSQSIQNLVSLYDKKIEEITGYDVSSFYEDFEGGKIGEGSKIYFKE